MQRDYKRLGYDDATSGRTVDPVMNDEDYMAGYREGLEARLQWATDELKQFNQLWGEA